MRKNKRKLRIGLQGCTSSNSNLGCVALTYSLIEILEEIRKRNNLIFEYCIFEANYNKEKLETLRKICQLQTDSITVCPLTGNGFIRKAYAHANVYVQLLRCDIVIDITAGDSFSDIYGTDKFYYYNNYKNFITRIRKPLILAPQTYGPFADEGCRQAAAKVIDKSVLAISRDSYSSEYMAEVCRRKLHVTTDVAFRLPYSREKAEEDDQVRIGINVSDLLYENGSENYFNRKSLNTNYTLYIDKIIGRIIQNNRYHVCLISHVGGDYAVAKTISQKYPQCEVVPFFDNPVEAKNYISKLDLFIGSRMHATIASLSSGVATIPASYSRKFEGLFGSLKYPYVVDLKKLTTDQAVDLTMQWIEEKDQLQISAKKSLAIARKLCNRTEELIERQIKILV